MLQSTSTQSFGRLLVAALVLAVILAQAVVAAGRVSDSVQRMRGQEAPPDIVQASRSVP